MGEFMFDIDEVKYLCYVMDDTFFLSSKSTYEYITFGDIDHYEILVNFDIEKWIRKLNRVTYKQYKDGYMINFFDEEFEVYMIHLDSDIKYYLKDVEFNIDAVLVKISIKSPGFSTYHIRGKEFHVSWVDPYEVRSTIKSGFIEPIHMDHIRHKGHLIFKMFELKLLYKLEVRSEIIEQLSQLEYTPFKKVKASFFKILLDEKSYDSIKALNYIGVLEVAFPLIAKMKENNLWDFGLYCLKKIEHILNADHYFQDHLAKAIRRNMTHKFESGLTKYQMIKFSILFHDAYKTMQLKLNSPELYEDQFTDFCGYFEFDEETCRYYAQIIQSSRKMKIELNDDTNVIKISDEKLYNFYEEYRDEVIDVLLVSYVDQLCQALLDEEKMKEKITFIMQKYISKYCEIQSINSEITTMEIDGHLLSDIELTLLIENVKKNVFFGKLRYDRTCIVNYFQKLIEQSD